MDVRYTVGKNEYSHMNTQELRDTFLIDSLFQADNIALTYCEVERSVVGSAVPVKGPLTLEAGAELASEYFCERREVGVLNIGQTGSITVDGKRHEMANLDCLYIGRGSKSVVFASDDGNQAAQFYFISYPAHKAYPTTHASKAMANPLHMGTVKMRTNAPSINIFILMAFRAVSW